jgi:glycosyltransferase involved in cell wall biosynthesis
MRVLIVKKGSLHDPGAAALEFVPKVLADMGHEVMVLAHRGEKTQGLVQGEIRVELAGEGKRWLRAVRNAMRNFEPEICHVHIHHGCGLYPLLFKGSKPRSFVLDIRSPLLSTGVQRKLRRWKNFLEALPYDAVCAHGVESGRDVVGPWRKIHWVPPGVDFGLLPEVEMDGLHSPLRLVYVGSSSRKRGIRKMLEAIAIASRSMELLADLFVYDDRDSPEKAIEEFGLGSIARVREPLPRALLFRELTTYDIGLAYIPKVPYDVAPPLKTQEYLACGLAVVGTDTAGNRMFVKEGVTGVLVPEDPACFARGILEAVNKIPFPEVRAIARSSMEPFDWKRIVQERLVPLYERLLPKKMKPGKEPLHGTPGTS